MAEIENRTQPNAQVEASTANNNIEVWEDLVNIKDLVLSLIICSVLTLGGYLIAPNEPPRPLIYGLIGAVAGFIISSIVVKPKRNFSYSDEGDE